MSLHNPISPLRAYYVQKVLPAVYDDSLSYYEILCKVQETLNEVVSTTNEQSVVVLEMQQAINDFIHGGYTDTFEEYLDEWFEENSDAFVQRLIDEGIIPEVADIQSDLETVHENIAELVAEDTHIRSDMDAADTSIRNDMNLADTELTNKKVPYPLVNTTPSYGTSGQVLATNADGTTDWQDPVIPSDTQAEQVITQWLNAHPEATTTVQDGAISTTKLADNAVTTAKIANGSVTDEKLVQSGGVLEEVSSVKSALIAFENNENEFVPELVSTGYVTYSNGTFGTFPNDTYARTGYIEILPDTYEIEFTAHFNAITGYALYDSNKVYISGSGTNTSNNKHTLDKNAIGNAKYIAITDFDENSDHSKVKVVFFVGEIWVEVAQSINNAQENAVLEANAYTDEKKEIAVSEAKAYTDEKDLLNVKKQIILGPITNMCKKQDITSSYPTVTMGLSASNIANGAFDVTGTSSTNYPNIIFNQPVTNGHSYLFAVTMKENTNISQGINLVGRYGGTPTTVGSAAVTGYPYSIYQNTTRTTFDRYAKIFTPDNSNYNSVDFTLSFDLSTSDKQADIAVKDVVICDVTGLTETEIVTLINAEYFDVYEDSIVVADYLTADGVSELKNELATEYVNNYWKGKKILTIGDSTSAGNVWQQKLVSNLGAVISNHALGGIGLLQMVVGSDGYDGEYDPETEAEGTLNPLYMADVYDKDLIILFGGFNNRNNLQGHVGDLYKTDGTGQTTIAGYLQFDLNWIFEKLAGGTDDSGTFPANLDCKILIIPPYCCGKYSWINADGYDEYPANSEQTLQTVAKTMIDVAHANNCSAWNAWEESGIGRNTWTIWSNSPTPTQTPPAGSTAPYPENADQLHLNNTGYAHFGECVSAILTTIR